MNEDIEAQGGRIPAKKGEETTAVLDSRADKGRHRNRERTREELQYAMLRVKNKGKKLNISAVAAEAGVTPGLIHNTYPDVAEAIRVEIGKATRQQRDEKTAELTKARERIGELRAELNAALTDLQRVVSANETLRQEVAILRSASSGKVVVLSSSAYSDQTRRPE